MLRSYSWLWVEDDFVKKPIAKAGQRKTWELGSKHGVDSPVLRRLAHLCDCDMKELTHHWLEEYMPTYDADGKVDGYISVDASDPWDLSLLAAFVQLIGELVWKVKNLSHSI